MDLYTNLCFPMHAVQIKIHNNKYADLRTLTVDPPEGGPLHPRAEGVLAGDAAPLRLLHEPKAARSAAALPLSLWIGVGGWVTVAPL